MRLEKTKLWTRALHPRSFSKGQTYVPSPISHHHPISLLQSAKPTSMHLSIKLPDIQAMQSKKLTSQDSNKAFLELHKWYIKITTKLFMNFWAFVWFSTIICQFSDPITTLDFKDSFFFHSVYAFWESFVGFYSLLCLSDAMHILFCVNG